MYDPTIGQFISDDPIGFDAQDPNIRRYVGNSPTNGTDPTGLQTKDDVQKALDAIRGNPTPDGRRTVADIGEITLTTSRGATVNVKILELDGANVTFEYEFGGMRKRITRPITEFSRDDQAFIEQLRVVPPNIVIVPSPHDASFVRTVVAHFVTLSKLPKGKEIVKGCKDVYDPPKDPRGIGGISNETLITITRTDRMVNGKPDSRITVSLNRVTGRLDAEFAPTIYFNPAGGFESLGKELWHGWQQISGAAVPNGNLTQWDLDAVDAIVNVLLDEFKRMSNE